MIFNMKGRYMALLMINVVGHTYSFIEHFCQL